MEVHRCYPLNTHVKALLGIGSEFTEPFDDDFPTDEDNLRTGSDVAFDSEDEIDPPQAGDGSGDNDARGLVRECLPYPFN